MGEMHASAEEVNILTSIVKHMVTALQGVNGPPTNILAANFWWPGRAFNSDEVDYFVRLTLDRAEGEQYTNVNGANRGSFMLWMATVDLYMKRVFVGTDLTKWPNTKALLRTAFKSRDRVAVTDWRAGSGDLGALRVRGTEERRPKPEDDWLSSSLVVSLEWIEQDVAA